MYREQEFIPNQPYTIHVDQPSQDPVRLDVYLSNVFSVYSRSFFSRYIDAGCITVNKAVMTKSSYLVKYKDLITIVIPPHQSPPLHHIEAKTLNVSFIHKDQHFYIIYKPPQLVVHIPHTHFTEPTLVDWIALNAPEVLHIGCTDRPGIVHRLDKDTSGLMVIARTSYGLEQFNFMFRNRMIYKKYFCLVTQHPPQQGSFNFAIGRDPFDRRKMICYSEGTVETSTTGKLRNALTHYKTVQYLDQASLVDVQTVTGRTHQIRAHFHKAGYPLLGDELYGTSSPHIERQGLHAAEIAFTLDGIAHHFTIPLPEDMVNAITRLTPQQLSEPL
ncbi:MAG: RluA family pseudouridine synthase [Candidatus Babeliales bacterium]